MSAARPPPAEPPLTRPPQGDSAPAAARARLSARGFPRVSARVGARTLARRPAHSSGRGSVGLLAVLAVAWAAAFAYGLTHVLALAFKAAPALGGAAWAAPAAAAAALSVALTAGLLGWVLLQRSADMAPGAGRVDAGHAPPAGMPRALFLSLAEREFARARRYGTGAALVLVDIDHHGRLCQARGAAAGQAVLTALLRHTAPTLRTADALTCLGDARMAIFLAHADATGALDVAERIRERTEQTAVPLPNSPLDLRLRVTVSAGVAHLRPAHLSLQALLDDALDAVSAARQAGGNCVRAAPVDPAVSDAPEPAAPGAPGAPHAPDAPDASGPWRERRTKTRPKPPRPAQGD